MPELVDLFCWHAMIELIRLDESAQILLFVCAPLLLLLVVGISQRMRVAPLTNITLPKYSLTVSTVGHGGAFVRYSDESNKLYLEAEVGPGKRFFGARISVQVPKELPNEQLQDVVANLASGLKSLRYEYLIYRTGSPQAIPKEESDVAIAELRQMGFEIQEASGPGKIGRAVTHDWHRVSHKAARARLSQVQTLMAKASRIRESIEVLARDD